MGIKLVSFFMLKLPLRNLSIAVTFFALCFAVDAGAQDPKRQYKNAHDFFNEGKYNLAMEMFKPLMTYDKDNPYSEYASFYYAMCALRQRYYVVAKEAFSQIKKTYPDWDQINEVNFWIAYIFFERGEYFQGMLTLKDVKQDDYIEQEQITKLRRHYLARMSDPEVLRIMWEEYPQDPDVGKALAASISRQPAVQQDRVLLDSVLKVFNLPREQYMSPAALSVFKDNYSVSVLFPFLASTLEPSPAIKQNQVMLDLFEGMRMATDTLRRHGTKINLLAYDTESNPTDPEKGQEALKRLLDKDELKNTDLIVGPFFRNEAPLVQQFSEKNEINMIHPVSSYSDFVGQNPYSFLFQPSFETLGIRSAELLTARIKNKNCMVMYGDAPKDSVLAVNFARRATELGFNVVWSEEFRKETAARIIKILATPTEYDESKNPVPIQFSLKLDSIGSIFVASDDPVIYTKVIASVETRGDSVIVVGSESWLDNTSVDLTKYERLHVMFAAPNFTPLRMPRYVEFRKNFMKVHGSYPAEYRNYYKYGYDFMMFVGQALKKYGVYFQEGLSRDGLQPGFLTRGYKLSPRHDNEAVPFVYFRNGELVAVE
jgi:ABC-type branched-subunit amino acid transport system substrate-binding protein